MRVIADFVDTVMLAISMFFRVRNRSALLGLTFIGVLLVITALIIVPGVVLWSINTLFPAAALELNFYTWCAVWFLVVIFRG